MSGLGHRAVWYMVAVFAKSILDVSSQAVRRWTQYVLTQISVITTWPHNPENYNFEF
jgi:hypothetical protein